MTLQLAFVLAILLTIHLFALSRSQNTKNNTSSFYEPEFCISRRHRDRCDGSHVRFYLHTRQGNEDAGVTDSMNNLTELSYYDGHRPNVILVHGYDSSMDLDTLIQMKKEYLIFGDYNVWAVDFRELVRSPCYPFAVYNVPYIGRCISLLINGIRNTATEPNVHIIGFSLGAHIAGRTGYELGTRQIARVTGLDPAMPLFFRSQPGERLSPNDAKFVDVIHTNMFMQGHYSSLGHVDFYLNGGTFQPGCTQISPSQQSACDHHRSTNYFAESINSLVGFWGFKCSSLFRIMFERCEMSFPQEEMGDGVNMNARGQYYVKTAGEKPYALGKPTGTTK